MKKTITGWIGKDPSRDALAIIRKLPEVAGFGACFYLPEYELWCSRGHKADWDSEDWPPRKVTITIEVED